MYRLFLKSTIDYILASSFIIVLFPIFLIVYFLVFIKLGSPIIFRQARPGKNGKVFFIYKFRTMTNKKNEKGILLSDAERLTSFGLFLRKFSLDEIPQLLNIIKGELSIVGPRPLLVEYLPLYNEFQRRRHNVKPGITGWAQVNGRNAISWQQKFEYDVWYTDNISFLLDIKIIILTIIKVFKRDGISSSSSITMEAFRGN